MIQGRQLVYVEISVRVIRVVLRVRCERIHFAFAESATVQETGVKQCISVFTRTADRTTVPYRINIHISHGLNKKHCYRDISRRCINSPDLFYQVVFHDHLDILLVLKQCPTLPLSFLMTTNPLQRPLTVSTRHTYGR